MDVERLALVQGIADTRVTLARWRAAPAGPVAAWTGGALAVAAALLLAVWAIAATTTPDPRPLILPGLNAPAGGADVLAVLARNSLVLALHALACVAGFIAGRSIPLQSPHRTGLSRQVHDAAAPAALLFVAAATLFSLGLQAYVLGRSAADLSAQLVVSPAEVVLSVLPHALLELVALFLPLAALIRASRRRAWEELLAATAVTCALAVPLLVLAALVEVHVWPDVMRALSPFE